MLLNTFERMLTGGPFGNGAGNYTIPQLDLSVKPSDCPKEFEYLYELSVVDDSLNYLGHPDSVLLKNGDILTLYPSGHGKGAVRGALSSDGGVSYQDITQSLPVSWQNSRETPTVYRLSFTDGSEKLLLCSGNPKWGAEPTTGGFNFSLSDDEGTSWSEFELVFDKKSKHPIPSSIVVMASLTRLKENGVFVDKWMGFFHNSDFVNYKTILFFDDFGRPHWTDPVPYFSKYRVVELETQMCEVEVIRSDRGRGDELCLISRSNSKKHNSLLSFSHDEGKTWSRPTYAPPALNGERHKADYLPDGRLFITFRSIERDKDKVLQFREQKSRDWFSEGYVAWVGTYDDIKYGREGQYRIKIAHTYLEGQVLPYICANADTAYCGNVVLGDGTIVTSTYGAFGEKLADGKFKTYVASKRIRLNDTDQIVNKL